MILRTSAKSLQSQDFLEMSGYLLQTAKDDKKSTVNGYMNYKKLTHDHVGVNSNKNLNITPKKKTDWF